MPYVSDVGGAAIPHLDSITNAIGTAEAYRFSYTTEALNVPFAPFTNYALSEGFLTGVTINGVNPAKFGKIAVDHGGTAVLASLQRVVHG
jgi:hypothetical protein